MILSLLPANPGLANSALQVVFSSYCRFLQTSSVPSMRPCLVSCQADQEEVQGDSSALPAVKMWKVLFHSPVSPLPPPPGFQLLSHQLQHQVELQDHHNHSLSQHIDGIPLQSKVRTLVCDQFGSHGITAGWNLTSCRLEG